MLDEKFRALIAFVQFENELPEILTKNELLNKIPFELLINELENIN